MKSDSRTQSKFLSFLLRHGAPEQGIELGPGGWAPIAEVDRVASFPVTAERIRAIVEDSDKARFEVSEDGLLVRATHGHSVEVDLQLSPKAPPNKLYHGTAERHLEAIRRDGLRPQSRQFVHLHGQQDTARLTGARHGKPVVLAIDAGRMHRDGHAFFESSSGVWLIAQVPPCYLDTAD